MARKQHRGAKRSGPSKDRRRNAGLNQQCLQALQDYERLVNEWIERHVVHEKGAYVKGSELVEKCHKSLRRKINKGTFGRMLKQTAQAIPVSLNKELFYINIRYVAKKTKGNPESLTVTTVCLPITAPKVKLDRKRG